MTILQRRRRAAGRKRVRKGKLVFRSYAHRGGPGCPCNECRWIRHEENACDRCGGEGWEKTVMDNFVACYGCKGSGQRSASPGKSDA